MWDKQDKRTYWKGYAKVVAKSMGFYRENKRADNGILYTLLEQNESNFLLTQDDTVDDEYLTSIHTQEPNLSGSQVSIDLILILLNVDKTSENETRIEN